MEEALFFTSLQVPLLYELQASLERYTLNQASLSSFSLHILSLSRQKSIIGEDLLQKVAVTDFFSSFYDKLELNIWHI